MFSGKILTITGGTGSFGNAVLSRFLDTNIKEIRILSRDEKKQEERLLEAGRDVRAGMLCAAEHDSPCCAGP